MKSLALLHDGAGGTLYVHLDCGATLWWNPAQRYTGGNGDLRDHRCEVCDPNAELPPDGRWERVWVAQERR